MRDQFSFYERKNHPSPVSLISIPTDLGSDARGLSKTPDYLREHGLHDMFAAIGIEIAEEKTIPCPTPPPLVWPPLKNLAEVAEVSEHAANAAQQAALKNNTVVAIGGDHSSAIGTIAGASRAHESLGVIWIDAHPDCHTEETTSSHNIHGMPAALAMGYGHPELLGKRKAISPEHFLYIGLKDFDEAEIEFLHQHSPAVHTMLDIAERGLSPVFSSIAELSRQVEKVWISLDMDSIDRAYAPGVAMPNTEGLTAREALSIARYIGTACDVAGLDVVEMLPANDVGDKTAGLALELIARLLGGDYSWYSKYMAQYEETAKVA